MNKAELVAAVQKNLGEDTSKAEAERSVDAVMEAIKGGIANDLAVNLVGFGSFSVAVRPARTGINPRTKEKIDIPEGRTIKFKAGANLRAVV